MDIWTDWNDDTKGRGGFRIKLPNGYKLSVIREQYGDGRYSEELVEIAIINTKDRIVQCDRFVPHWAIASYIVYALRSTKANHRTLIALKNIKASHARS